MGVDYIMNMILWSNYILKSQVYSSNKDIFQGNQSSMLLEKNRRDSRGKITRHVNITYSFMSDRVKSVKVNIKYYPSYNMIGDCFTKPLQG